MEASSAAIQMYRGDPSIFAGESAATSLGWLRHVDDLAQQLEGYQKLWHEVQPRHARTVLLGMGGSSTPASLLARTGGYDALVTLDTSNPESIQSCNFEGVNVIASSKSGTTIETVTTLAWALGHGLESRDLIVITDEGTSLAQLGLSLGAKVVYGDPATGGRFSALSAFGLLPALASGWRAEDLAATGFTTSPSESDFVEYFNRGVRLVDETSEPHFFSMSAAPLSGSAQLWLEQLVAESTGKMGRGVIPVVEPGRAEQAPQRVSVVRDLYAWHVSASAMAWALGVDPFNQPDVQGAKTNLFSEIATPYSWQGVATVAPKDLAVADGATYVALQVFGPLSLEGEVENLRQRARQRFSHVTANLGPRFLHSCGQLHKGGPAGVVAVQILVRPRVSPERITGRGYSFHDLHFAQARADARALRAAGRHVIELRVESLDEADAALGLGSTMDR